MKFIRVLVTGVVAAVLAGCSLSSAGMVDLDTVPYSFHPTNGLESKLSVEPMSGPWGEEVFAGGVESAAIVNYKPEEGDPTIFMVAYYMPEDVYDGAIFPDEPSMYGTEVLRADGYVLAVAGPQDSIFDPETTDGKNIGVLSEIIYDTESYMPK